MTAVAASPLAPADVADPARVARLGMWIFLATELLFFGGLLVAYAYARTHWPQGFAVASSRTDVVLGTVNTGVLLTSSAVVAFAVACAEDPAHRRWTARALWVTAVLGVVFLGVKGAEYAHEWREHLFPRAGFALADVAGAELFFVLYFVMTALHALHLLIGISGVAAFAWGSGMAKPWATAPRVEAMALYWHFVDVVWILLYPLLYLVQRHG